MICQVKETMKFKKFIGDWVDDTNEEEVVKKLLFQTKHEQIVKMQQEYDLKKLQESSEHSESSETASASCSKYPTS